MTGLEARSAALIAAAAFIGPTAPRGVVDRRPEAAAQAVTRMADLLLPWLEGAGPPPAAAAAAKAAPAVADGTGKPRNGVFLACDNCGTAYADEQALVEAYNTTVQELNQHHPTARPVAPAPGPTCVRFCPNCLHEF
jgi:hypothetical protein